MKEPVNLDIFQGHVVLFCKGHYKINDFFEGLKMIWAIRCGYDYNPNEGDRVLEYIADDMLKIIIKCRNINTPEKMLHLMDVIHKEVTNQAFWKPKDMSPIKAIIWEYRSIISQLTVREKPEGKKRYKPIINIPKPMKQTFNRILNGNGKYTDYDLIKKKYKTI